MSSVCRVAKQKGYTVMSNYHLRDQSISLKSKGLLSQILSLPEDWDYTVEGLAMINKESRDAIRTSVRELEAAGYIVRHRDRDDLGRLRSSVYIIYEKPQTAEGLCDDMDYFHKPTLDNPAQEKSALGNPTQLNKDIQSKDIQNTESILSYPDESAAVKTTDRMGLDETARASYRKLLMENIEFDYLALVRCDRLEELNEILELMVDVISTGKGTVQISGDNIPAEVVRARLLKLTSNHILYVIDRLSDTETKIRNIRQYTLACLYNAPTTMENFYAAQVRNDWRQ